MLLHVKGSILLEGPIYLSPNVSVLSKLLLCASRHVVYVDCTKVVIIYELVDHPSIMMFIEWIQLRPCI